MFHLLISLLCFAKPKNAWDENLCMFIKDCFLQQHISSYTLYRDEQRPSLLDLVLYQISKFHLDFVSRQFQCCDILFLKCNDLLSWTNKISIQIQIVTPAES